MSFHKPFLFLVFFLFAASAFSQVEQQEFFPFIAEVLPKTINVRSGQSINFEKIASLKKGEQIIVVDKSYSWYKVQLPETADSFISNKYIENIKGGEVRVMGNRVNIRAGAGINFSILGQLSKGAAIIILEELEGWVRIEPIQESYGWIKEDLLVFKSNDISTYKSTMIELEVIEDKVEEIIEKTVVEMIEKIEVVEEAKILLVEDVVEPKKKEQFLVVTGFLELKRNNTGEPQYHLVSQEKNIYFLQGRGVILNQFIGYKVMIEGFVIKKDKKIDSAEIINVSKLEMLL